MLRGVYPYVDGDEGEDYFVWASEVGKSHAGRMGEGCRRGMRGSKSGRGEVAVGEGFIDGYASPPHGWGC